MQVSNDCILYCNTEISDLHSVRSLLTSEGINTYTAKNPHVDQMPGSSKVLLKVSSPGFSGGECLEEQFGHILNMAFTQPPADSDEFTRLMSELYYYLFKVHTNSSMVISIQRYVDGISCNTQAFSGHWHASGVREQFFRDVCELSLQAALRHRIFHWDIRPENILFLLNSNESQCKFYVVDWESSDYWVPNSSTRIDHYIWDKCKKTISKRASISQTLMIGPNSDISASILFALCEELLECISR